MSPFFVAKKANRQRVVWDCRIANTHFRVPPKPDMGAAEALQRLEMPEGQRLFEAEADVKDCFYQCGLPGEYSAYFCVDEKTDPQHVRALGLSLDCFGRPIVDGTEYCFCLVVLPMG